MSLRPTGQSLNISLSWRLPEDKKVWNWERNSYYSVRSAYHLLKEESQRGIAEPSVAGNNGIWKDIWKIRAPQRIKNFMWRVSKHILPTRCWLEQKGVAPDADCLLCHCHNDMESQDHLFMHCQVIRSFWFMSPLGLYVLINMHLSQRMLQWLSNPNLQVTQLFSLSLWTI